MDTFLQKQEARLCMKETQEHVALSGKGTYVHWYTRLLPLINKKKPMFPFRNQTKASHYGVVTDGVNRNRLHDMVYLKMRPTYRYFTSLVAPRKGVA